MAAAKKNISDNMKIYEGHREPPKEALKPIQAGRLKGMSDINPMWRIKALTEEFGPCGIGWYYTVDKQWLEPCGDETVAFVNVSLYVKENDEWSKPIFGTGGSKIISMERNGAFVSDECVDGDCEVLTKHGWVKFRDYNGEEEIAQFEKDSSVISFVKPLRFIHKHSSNTYKKGNIIMTYGHRNLYETSRGERRVDIAENLCGYEGKNYFDLHCGILEEEKELTALQKVGIMLCCDGTKYSVYNKGNITWNIAFSKDRKIVRCKELLKNAGIEIKYEHTSKRDNPKWNDYTQLRFTLDDTDYKKYSEFLPFGNYKNLFEELIFWDGNYAQYIKNGDGSYFSVDYENISHIQTLLMFGGQYSTIYKKERKEKEHKDAYTLYNHKTKRTKLVPIKKYGEDAELYCVEVPSTFFMIRKDNEIYVTGNCYKMATTDAISVACKQLGIAADVYWNNDRTKYSSNSTESSSQTNQRNKPESTQDNSKQNTSEKTAEELAAADPESVDKDLVPQPGKVITKEQIKKLESEMNRTGITLQQILKMSQVDSIEKIPNPTYIALMNKFAKTKNKKE